MARPGSSRRPWFDFTLVARYFYLFLKSSETSGSDIPEIVIIGTTEFAVKGRGKK